MALKRRELTEEEAARLAKIIKEFRLSDEAKERMRRIGKFEIPQYIKDAVRLSPRRVKNR